MNDESRGAREASEAAALAARRRRLTEAAEEDYRRRAHELMKHGDTSSGTSSSSPAAPPHRPAPLQRSHTKQELQSIEAAHEKVAEWMSAVHSRSSTSNILGRESKDRLTEAVFRQEQEKTDDEWKAAALRGGLEGKWLDRLASDRPFGLHLATESRRAKEEEDKKEAKKAGQGGFHHYKHLDVLSRAPGVVLGGTRWA